jgi:hypothetical protein
MGNDGMGWSQAELPKILYAIKNRRNLPTRLPEELLNFWAYVGSGLAFQHLEIGFGERLSRSL